MLKLINETVAFLKQKGFEKAEIGIVLGTGLGQLLSEIEIIQQVNYNQIPNFFDVLHRILINIHHENI